MTNSMTSLPAHMRIAEQLRERITSGAWAPGARLPAERMLAEQLGVSRMTVRQALAALQLEGRISRRTGRSGGTFVAEELPEVELSSMRGFMGQLSETGHDVTSEVVTARLQPASAEAATALGLDTGAEVVRVHRLRLVDGTPVLVEDSCFPAALVPGMLEYDLTGSLYAILAEAFGQAAVSKTEALTTEVVGSADGKLLQIGAAQTVLRLVRTSFTTAGIPIEYSTDTLRTDRLRITVSTPSHAG